MSTLLLCRRPTPTDSLCTEHDLDLTRLRSAGCKPAGIITPFTPYLVDSIGTPTQHRLTPPAPAPHYRDLTQIALTLGDDNTVALADIADPFFKYGKDWLNTASGMYATRMNNFSRAAVNYQNALLRYRDAMKTSPALRTIAKQQAQIAHQALQKEFHREISVVTQQIRSRRGTALQNFNRAINIAGSSRDTAKLYVGDQLQLNKLVNFAKYAKFLNTGMTVIDFTNRAGNVHNTYQEGGEWQRELFVESVGFVVGGLIGTASSSLFMLLCATPVGWSVVIIGGVAIAGIGAATAIQADKSSREWANKHYDVLLKELAQ